MVSNFKFTFQNEDALDIRDELGFITQQHVDTKEDNTSDTTTLLSKQDEKKPSFEEDSMKMSTDDVTIGSETSKKSSIKHETFPCDECGKTYKTKWSLREHKRTHTEVGKECSICGKKFWKDNRLELHMSTVHYGVRFKCEDCEASYMSFGALGTHRREKHMGVMYKCEECGSVYKSRAGMHAHKAMHKNVFKHMCSQCPKGFHYKQDYVDHMAMHAGLKEHGCHKCGTYFTVKANMQRHLLYCGTTDKNFVCSQCGCKFKVLRYLKDHVKQVHGEKEQGCHRCGKLFTNRHSLLKHLKVCGVTDLDFECSKCSKRFKTKGYLSEHVKQMHENKLTAKCSECGEMFRYRATLQKHKKKTGHK